MSRIFLAVVIAALSTTPTFAAKWNQLKGDELKAVHNGTVTTGYWKKQKYTTHYCTDGRSFQKFGKDKVKERELTFENDDVMCVKDDRGKRCYHAFQNAKKPHKLRFENVDGSTSGKYTLTDKSPDWCS